jgi:molybdopterin converting factor small subunit
MRISIHLYARARDLAGQSLIELQLPENCRLSEARERLAAEYPRLRELLPRCAWAVNEEFATDDMVLSGGVTLALIPPVSGGQ